MKSRLLDSISERAVLRYCSIVLVLGVSVTAILEFKDDILWSRAVRKLWWDNTTLTPILDQLFPVTRLLALRSRGKIAIPFSVVPLNEVVYKHSYNLIYVFTLSGCCVGLRSVVMLHVCVFKLVCLTKCYAIQGRPTDRFDRVHSALRLLCCLLLTYLCSCSKSRHSSRMDTLTSVYGSSACCGSVWFGIG